MSAVSEKMPIFASETQHHIFMSKEQKDKLTYIVYCISMFGERFSLPTKQAFSYLKRYGGLAFIDECYAAEHTLSLDDAVADMAAVCKRNGGGLI